MSEIASKILKVGKKSVRDAQKESLKKGIANVYSKNKQLYFQLPDGTITQSVPKEYRWAIEIVDADTVSERSRK